MCMYYVGSLNLAAILAPPSGASTHPGSHAPTAAELLPIKTFTQRITDKKFAHVITTVQSERVSIYTFPVSLILPSGGGGSRISGVSAGLGVGVGRDGRSSVRVSSPSLYSTGPSLYAMDDTVIDGEVTTSSSLYAASVSVSASARNTQTHAVGVEDPGEEGVLNPLNSNNSAGSAAALPSSTSSTRLNSAYTWLKGRTTTPDITTAATAATNSSVSNNVPPVTASQSSNSLPRPSGTFGNSHTNTNTNAAAVMNANKLDGFKLVDTIAVLYFNSITTKQ